MMNNLRQHSDNLCKISIRLHANPYELFDWPDSLEQEQWFFTPELLSLYGEDEYEIMSESEKQRYSFHEIINLFSLNIHGEINLIQGISEQLYKDWPLEISNYLHHFLDEENKHIAVFAKFCNKYANKIYPDRKMNFSIRPDYDKNQLDFLFFAQVVIFEEILDAYNVAMSKDARLNPLVQELSKYHHKDESRHLAFGRKITRTIFDEHSGKWSERSMADIRNYLSNAILSVLREYSNPNAYKDAGLANEFDLYQKCWLSANG